MKNHRPIWLYAGLIWLVGIAAAPAQIPPAAGNVPMNQTPATAMPADAFVYPTLGRLFLTPERRAVLENQRQLNLPATEAVESETLELNGIVRRSSGSSSVWINNRVQHGATSSMGVDVARDRAGSANVQTDADASTRLRVGESVDRATQQRHDVVGPNAVRSGPTRP